MPNTEKWYNRGEFTEYLNCEIRDFKTGKCSDEIEVPEYRIEAILAHHRELIVKEIREEIDGMRKDAINTLKTIDVDEYENRAEIKGIINELSCVLSLPCLKENE